MTERARYFFEEFERLSEAWKDRLTEVSLSDGFFSDVLNGAKELYYEQVVLPRASAHGFVEDERAIASFRYRGILIDRDHGLPEGAICWHQQW